MSVGAAYRGVGVGSALLQATLAWAADVGYSRVVLSAFPHNTRAIAFYERHGFTLEGCRPRQFCRDGCYIDELLMGRLVGSAVEAAVGPAVAGATAAPDGVWA